MTLHYKRFLPVHVASTEDAIRGRHRDELTLTEQRCWGLLAYSHRYGQRRRCGARRHASSGARIYDQDIICREPGGRKFLQCGFNRTRWKPARNASRGCLHGLLVKRQTNPPTAKLSRGDLC